MPLTAKGKKLKKKFREQYGDKKGDSIFYAMENSGKLKKVIKARGGKDASQADFGDTSTTGGDDNREKYGAKGQYTQTRSTKVGGDKTKTVTVRTGPKYIDTRPLGIFTPVTYQVGATALNLTKKSLYDAKNLREQKKIDPLGGEMLTTGRTGVKGPDRTGNRSVQPVQPIQPIATTKKIDKSLINPKDNFFNFVAYKVGGLSGGVSYGPPPKRGPNSQVPPIKLKKGGKR